MNTACPKCGAADTQSFAIANKAGTSSGSVAGLGMTADGSIGVGRGFSTQQTEIAKLTQPPANVFWVQEIVFIVLCLVVMLMILIPSLLAGYYVIGIVASLLAGAAAGWFGWQKLSRDTTKARAAYKAALLKWEHSWLCLRCGNTYYVR